MLGTVSMSVFVLILLSSASAYLSGHDLSQEANVDCTKNPTPMSYHVCTVYCASLSSTHLLNIHTLFV